MQFRSRYDAISQIHQIKLIEDIRDSSEYYVRNKNCSRKWNPITTVPRHLSDNEIERLQDDKFHHIQKRYECQTLLFSSIWFFLSYSLFWTFYDSFMCATFFDSSADSLYISLSWKKRDNLILFEQDIQALCSSIKKGYQKKYRNNKTKRISFPKELLYFIGVFGSSKKYTITWQILIHHV